MTQQTNEARCVLAAPCKLAGTPACNDTCGHYIAIHSASGRHTLAGLPKDYRLVTLADSPARADQADIYARLTKYASTFERVYDGGDRIKSVYLYSESPGTGKTTTAAALLNAYLTAVYLGAKKRGLAPPRQPAYFLDVNEAQTTYNGFNRGRVPDEIAAPKATEYYRQLERAKQADFAVLDDIGVRSATEGFRSDLHDVINHRVTNERPTVYTSNIAMDGLADVFDARLADRIGDMCVEFEFAGDSKRGRR
ncbi:DNA replication protein [Alteribacter populi]|uniref:DNA replication protein n=1 Tax=Alteribacter populi TaxID=2011011 RepID=UPI000BBA9DD6|nr:DNA replication protein [Alteribacter populi]